MANLIVMDPRRDGTLARALGGLVLQGPAALAAMLGPEGMRHLTESIADTRLDLGSVDQEKESRIHHDLIELAPLDGPVLLGKMGDGQDPMELLDILGQAYAGLDFHLPAEMGKRLDHSGLVLVYFGLALELVRAGPGGPIEDFCRNITAAILARTCGGLEQLASRLVREAPVGSLYRQVGEEVQIQLEVLRDIFFQ